MKLRKEEKELILKKRQEEESQKPKKEGLLKHDLYYFSFRYPKVEFSVDDIVSEEGWWLTKETMLSIVEQIKDELLETFVKKGTHFDCYIDNGEEEWYDSEGIGIEGYTSDWAKKNLIDIKDI